MKSKEKLKKEKKNRKRKPIKKKEKQTRNVIKPDTPNVCLF